MKLTDKINAGLSVIAIIISIAVWQTNDTRASELRGKVIKYSIIHGRNETNAMDITDHVAVTISNVGALPTRDVILTISTKSADGKIPPYTVEINPSVDREIVVQDRSLVIRLKNPLGPNSGIDLNVAFNTAKTGKFNAKDFELKQAFVDSEVGAATLVSSIGGASGDL